MNKQKSKKSKRSVLKKRDIKSLIPRVLFCVVCLSLVWTLISQQFTISSQKKEISSLESKVREAEQLSENLEQQVNNLEDPEYIERIAREQLGLVRPNERVFVDSNKSEENNNK